MRIVNHWTSLDTACKGASVAMGNFDGVHLGHQTVIDLARRDDAPLGIVTFEPHPREFFAPAAPLALWPWGVHFGTGGDGWFDVYTASVGGEVQVVACSF